MSAPPPIVFTVTDAGQQAALDALNTGLTLRLTHIALGSGAYAPDGTETTLQDELGRWPLSGGDVEPNSNTLRFFSSVVSTTSFDAFEAGLFDENNVLFAVASRTNGIPLIPVHANIAFIGSYGLKLTNIPANAVSVVTDPNAALAAMLLLQHTTHANPHPQYAMAAQNDLEHANLVTLIAGVVQALQQHENALNPHPQYALASQNDLEQANLVTLIAGVVQALQQHEDALNPHQQYALASEINPRYLFRFIYDGAGFPYATSYGYSSGEVTHNMIGSIGFLCFFNQNLAYHAHPISEYSVEGINFGVAKNRKGYLLNLEGYIQFGSYIGQGDAGFSQPEVKIQIFDQNLEFLIEAKLNLSLMTSGFPNNGNIGQVRYRISNGFDFYDLISPNGQPPSDLYGNLLVSGLSSSNGGGTDLQILTVESFAIFCSY